MTSEYLRGLADAAAIADTYATENFRLATDSILTDPILSRRSTSPAAWEVSEQCQLDGTVHSSMAHAAQFIAQAIRAKISDHTKEHEGMNRINIDGRIFVGNTVRIRGNSVWIDGAQQDGTLSGVVEIRVVEGIIDKLETDASVTCGNVTGDVTASGSVRCNNVGRDVAAGGSVHCADVRGGIVAGGSVRMVKGA